MVWNMHSAENQISAFDESMNVISMTDSEIHILSSLDLIIASAIGISSGEILEDITYLPVLNLHAR